MAVKSDVIAGNSEFSISNLKRALLQEGIFAKFKAARYFTPKTQQKLAKQKAARARLSKQRRLARLAANRIS